MISTLRMKSPALALATSALFCTLPQHARGAVLVQDLDFAFGPLATLVGQNTMTVADQRTRQFQQFDPTLGTLQSARWELVSAWGADVQAVLASVSTNRDAPVAGVLGLQVAMDTRINFAGGLAGTGGLYFSTAAATSAECVTTLAFGPCVFGTAMGTLFDGVIEATVLDELIGFGQFEQGVEAALALSTLLEGPGSVSAFTQLQWADRADRNQSGRLRLVYDFDPHVTTPELPEPPSGALAGAALFLLAGLRRLRRRR
jgi:hypothetical protein